MFLLRALSIFLFFGVGLSLATAQTGILNQDTLIIESFDCGTAVEVCLDGISPGLSGNYTIEVDGLPYDGVQGACAFSTVGVYNFANFLQLAPVGPYQVTSWNLNGVDNTGNFSTFSELVDLMNQWDPTGNWNLQFPLLIGGDATVEYDTLFLKSITFNSEGELGYSTGFLPNGITIEVAEGPHTIIVTETATGAQDTLVALIQCSSTVIVQELVATGGTGSYCPSLTDLGSLPVSSVNICEDFSDGNAAFSTPDALGCITYDGLQAGSDTACIVICDDAGFCDTTILIVVVVDPPPGNVNFLYDTMQIGSITTICDPIWNNDTIFNICPIATSPGVTFNIFPGDDCLNIQANTAGVTDTACIVSCPIAGGTCDTTYVIITVSLPNPALVFEVSDTIYLNGSAQQYCYFDNSVGLLNICPDLSGESVIFADLPLGCISYAPLNLGIDTACFIACGEQICDTIYMYITVLAATSPDTASIEVGEGLTSEFCVNTNELGQTNVSLQYDSALADNAQLSSSPNGYCIDVTGLAVGSDTLTLILFDELGLSDTTLLYIFVVPTILPNYFVDTIAPLTEGILCLDLSDLTGPVESIQSPCGSPNLDILSFELDQENYCVTYSGIGLGTDSICYVLCDINGICDTTFLVINVSDIIVNPIASDDYFTTSIDSSIFVTVFSNDLNITPNSTLTLLYSTTGGSLNELSSGIFEYDPNTNFCGLDSFSYVVCNDTLCDTAVVNLQVVCPDSLIIYTGISPNGDGSNDTWKISGLNLIPNHLIQIYNRWGNLLYESTNYQNDWGGTFQDKDLPDHVYFYLIRNQDTGKSLSGYIQVYR